MAFLSGIFGPAPTPAPAAAAAPVPNSATNPANAAPAPAPGAPAPVAASTTTAANNSALDTLQQLITPKPEVVAARAEAAKNAPQGFLPAVTPEQVNSALASADFMGAVPADVIAKAVAGDIAAFSQAVNAAARAAVASSMQMSHTLAEQAATAATSRWGSSLDSRFNELQLRNHTPANPALQHPMAKAQVKMFATQIANANPNLTPQEVALQAETNFLQMVNEISGQATQVSQQANAPAAPPERDWMKYMETPGQ